MLALRRSKEPNCLPSPDCSDARLPPGRGRLARVGLAINFKAWQPAHHFGQLKELCRRKNNFQ